MPRNRRIDRTLDRIDASLEQNERVIARNSDVIEETRHSYENQLEITRQFMRRNELVFEGQMRALDGQTGTMERLIDRIDERSAEMISELRAQRSAIFALIDEMRGGTGGTAPAG